MYGSSNYGGSRNYGGPRDSGPREMTKVTCSDCGKECEVPFKPTEGRPVYCRDCLPKHRKPRVLNSKIFYSFSYLIPILSLPDLCRFTGILFHLQPQGTVLFLQRFQEDLYAVGAGYEDLQITLSPMTTRSSTIGKSLSPSIAPVVSAPPTRFCPLYTKTVKWIFFCPF